MEHLTKALGPNTFTASLINTDIQTPEKLNSDCGADYVKMYQKEPRGFSIPAGARCASLDGDADRIVFYYQDAKSVFKLLDGDKIATLAAGFIMRLVKEAGLSEKDIQVGLVQTAYANGSSTSYVKDTLVRCFPSKIDLFQSDKLF